MKDFNKRWDISKNWQLLYPILGLAGLIYSAYKLIGLFGFTNQYVVGISTLILSYVLLNLTLKLFDFLEKRWKVDQRWKVIRIFIIFAITGSMSVVVTKPIFEAVGFVKGSLGDHAFGLTIFYILKFILILPFYKVLLVFFGWIFREYDFFLNFALKLANRMGLKKLTERFGPKA